MQRTGGDADGRLRLGSPGGGGAEREDGERAGGIAREIPTVHWRASLGDPRAL
jgi:hypothetical protein